MLTHHQQFVDQDLGMEGTNARRFVTTRWSIVLAAGANSHDTASVALAELCRLYWRPIFAFICQCGHAEVDAQDLTQDFFVSVIDGNLLRQADPDRGRFRSLLLKAVRNFVADAHQKQQSKKRGGDREFISWDDWTAESPSQLILPKESLQTCSAERLFDIRWAATVVEQAMARLREEYEASSQRRVFDALSPWLGAPQAEISYASLGSVLGGADEATVKRLMHRLRLRHRTLLRKEVARTLADAADIEDEIRHLCAVLAVSG